MNGEKPFWQSKTFWGIVQVVVGLVTHPDVLGLFSKEVSGIILALGSALTAWGLRSATVQVGEKVDENTVLTAAAVDKKTGGKTS